MKFKRGDKFVSTTWDGYSHSGYPIKVLDIEGNCYFIKYADGKTSLWDISTTDELYEHIDIQQSPLYKALRED